MFIWSSFADVLRVVLFSLAHVCGGSLGGGIVVLSLIIRLALLPLTLRMAIRAREYQAIVSRLAPKLEALRKRHANDPAALARATGELHAANGIGLAPKGVLLGTAVQMPIGAGVYQAIATSARRAVGFLWVTDLTRPDALVASLAAGLAGAAVMSAPAAGSGSARTAAILTAAGTFFFAWRLSASVGLYWVASNVVGVIQSLLLRRRAARAGA
jgi:YidC/Oxa1 family membrane protein insertase